MNKGGYTFSSATLTTSSSCALSSSI